MQVKLITKKRVSRMKKIRSFRVVEYSESVLGEFIPTKPAARAKLYEDFAERGIVLPPYESFKRKALRRRDMKVLGRDWYMIFDYCGKRFKVTVKTGACWDGASVPLIFVFGNVSKFNQYVEVPALVHDCLFALKLQEFEDANNIFSALLRWNKINKFALGRYMLGVRSPVGRMIYKKGKPSCHWLKGFVDFKEYE